MSFRAQHCYKNVRGFNSLIVKRRIAIIIYGGIGNGPYSQGVPMLHNIIRGLARHFEIVVYSQSPPNDGFEEKMFEVRSPSEKIRSSWLRWLFLCRNLLVDHRKKPFKVVFAFWGYPAGLVAVALSKIIGRASVIYLQGGDIASIPEIKYGTFYKRSSRFLATWAYTRATLLLAMSLYQRDALRRYNIKNEIAVIPWGLDLQRFVFRPKEFNGELKVIHVGHFTPVKDQATLVRAFADINRKIPSRLRMYGADAGCKPEIERLCTQLNIKDRIQFYDVVQYDEMPKHYDWADIMLHTSLSEGQCMALTEAAATGVLMAGTNIAPLYDLGEACGVIVERGDFKSLSYRVLQILSKPEEWRDKIQCARRWTEQHPIDWTIAEVKNRLMKL
jgi:glycosyltransferase involved in cell wall biosynthesis